MKLSAVIVAVALVGGVSTLAIAQTTTTNTTTNSTTDTNGTTGTNGTTDTNGTTGTNGTTPTNTTVSNSTSGNFGSQVSALAHDKEKGAHHGLGATVSAMAHALHLTNSTDDGDDDTNSTTNSTVTNSTATNSTVTSDARVKTHISTKGQTAKTDAAAVASAHGDNRNIKDAQGAVNTLRGDVRSSVAETHAQVSDLRSNAAAAHASVQQVQDIRANVDAVRHGH